MGLTSGHQEVIRVFRLCKLIEREVYLYELAAPGIFNRIERLQVELGNLGYTYSDYVFKHSRLPKITMIPEPELMFRMSE